MSKPLKCTDYTMLDEGQPDRPCQCPVCGGFLKWEGENLEIPKCNKCGADLIAIPEKSESTGEEYSWGKICPISLAKKEGLLK